MESEVEYSEKPIRIKKYRKVVIGIIILICTLIVMYLGMAIYFMGNFYFGSTINGIIVSGKKMEEVNKHRILINGFQQFLIQKLLK